MLDAPDRPKAKKFAKEKLEFAKPLSPREEYWREDKDELRLDDLRIIEKAYHSLPEHKKPELLTLVKEFSEKVKHEPPLLPDVCPREKTYDVWKVENNSRDGKECLLANWGDWLKAGNDNLDRDYISQADLGRLDEKLLIRLRAQFRAKELNEFLPSQQALNKQIASTISESEKREIYRKAVLVTRHCG